MRRISLGWIIILLLSCSKSKIKMEKIKFDIVQFDTNGFIGPVDGKRTLAYEFCIPNTASAKQAVSKIEPTIRFSNSPGRIACSRSELLCLGETNDEYKRVFMELTKLQFVEAIEQTFFE